MGGNNFLHVEMKRECGELGGGGKEGCNFPNVTNTKSDDYQGPGR